MPPKVGLLLEGRTCAWASRIGWSLLSVCFSASKMPPANSSLAENRWVTPSKSSQLPEKAVWVKEHFLKHLAWGLPQVPGLVPLSFCLTEACVPAHHLSNKSKSAVLTFFKTKGHVNKKEWFPPSWKQVTDKNKAVSLCQKRDRQWTQCCYPSSKVYSTKRKTSP